MLNAYDVTDCLWCKGDGKDHGTLGMALVRECPRCEGSGRVYTTNRESATGRRRVYKGPAPRPGIVAAREQEQLTQILKKPTRSTTRAKHGRSHAA